MADIITTALKTSPKNNLETNEEEEMRREICISKTKTENY